MVEILFARGFIKVLFCTETMSVGINLPVKTTIFTDVNKFNGEINRMLYSHEYTQAAGRAGRLGLDKVGHVIHLNNLFRNIDSVNYKLMMNGKPQILTSKFKISYNLLLNLLDIGDNNLIKFSNRSMLTKDLENQIKEICDKINILQNELNNIINCVKNLRTPINIIEEFVILQKNKETAINKKRKEIERQIQQIIDNYKFIDQDRISYQKISTKESEIYSLQRQYESINSFVKLEIVNVLNLLKEEGLIETDIYLSADVFNDNANLKLTFLGKIASQIKEVHCLTFAKLIQNKEFQYLSSKQLASLFSIFTNISVQEDFKDNYPKIDDKHVVQIVNSIKEMYDNYRNKELQCNINSGFDYNIHFDLLNYIEEWCDCNNIEQCKQLLEKIGSEKEIFLGEFVKALLKINNISCEIENIAEYIGDIDLLTKLKNIPQLTLKYIATNQSLYV